MSRFIERIQLEPSLGQSNGKVMVAAGRRRLRQGRKDTVGLAAEAFGLSSLPILEFGTCTKREA